MKITLQASAIRAAVVCAAKKDIRYYLQGVHVNVAHRDYATVVGTNGHILFAGRAGVENLEGALSPFSLTIPLDVAKKIDKKAAAVVLETLPDNSYMLDGMRFTPIDGRYPDYSRVIPRADQTQTQDTPSQYDYELLSRGNDALNAYYGGKSKVYPIVQRGNDSGVMHNGENVAVVVVMPMRVKDVNGYQGYNDTFPEALQAAPILKVA